MDSRAVAGVRRRAVADLAATVAAAVDGHGSPTLVLTAGPGAGKTSTLREIVSGLTVATSWATGDELSWRRPFGVAGVLLDTELPNPLPLNAHQILLDRVDELCSRERRLLIVDDAHHADAATLELLGMLAGAARDLPLTLLIARRPLPRRDQLNRLAARPLVQSWSLPIMDAIDLEILAHHVLGAWPSKELLQRLTSSGGNALHAVSVLHELRRTGAISIDGDRATVVREAAAAASTLRDMISAQLALLDGSSRGLLQKLAVWGSATTLEQLASIDQSNPVALLEPVQTAVGSGTATLSETGYLAFTHDLYAEVLYDELAPALRRLLHTAIAQVSTQRSDTQIVAHHLVAAGAPQALDAVYNAESELTSVPAVAVDLLDSAAHMGE